MAPTVDNRLVVLLALLVAGVGALDSAIGQVWDLFVVFGALVVLLLLLGLQLNGARQSVPLRRDLVVWLRRRAAAGSEPLEAVADRAVAAYRAGFVGDVEGRTSEPTAGEPRAGRADVRGGGAESATRAGAGGHGGLERRP